MSRPPKTQHPESPIAVRRLALGWTQMELVRRTGVRLITVQRHEAMAVKTLPTHATLLIAAALGCAVEDLVAFRRECITHDMLGMKP